MRNDIIHLLCRVAVLWLSLTSSGLGQVNPGALSASNNKAKPVGKEKDAIELALAALNAGDAAELKNLLITDSLTVLNDKYRAAALAALPAEMRQARLTQGHSLRLAEMNLQRVLVLHERPKHAPVELFLLRDETAQAMLWRGCVLVLSVGLVNALSDAE